MVTPEEVKKLAALARVKVAEDALPKFVKEFEAILAYVGQLEKLELPSASAATAPKLRNVMRDDANPHEGGIYTEKLVAQFPDKEGSALRVKQIITHE